MATLGIHDDDPIINARPKVKRKVVQNVKVQQILERN